MFAFLIADKGKNLHCSVSCIEIQAAGAFELRNDFTMPSTFSEQIENPVSCGTMPLRWLNVEQKLKI